MSEIQGRPLHIDAFELLSRIPDDIINLVFCDPPYNIGIFTKMSNGEYLAWCERWIAEASRVLRANGAFWISHKHPDVLVELSKMVARCGRGRINWVTWDKYNEADNLQGFMDGYTVMTGLRSFQVMAEYLVYHADEGQWTSQCDKKRGFIFEPLRAWFQQERKRACLSFKEINTGLGTASSGGGMASHYFGDTFQWELPTPELYKKMQQLFNRNNGNDYLRREYEDLRYTFNNPGKVSSVWQIPPASSNGHPTPKPEQLLDRIISTTTNPNDLILDFFAGSFTTAIVAKRLNRRWICGDHNEKWVKLGKKRLNESVQLEIFAS